jgi:hypothetical protein
MTCDTGGFEQCFNAQAAGDVIAQIIAAAGLTQSAADLHELLAMGTHAGQNTDRQSTHDRLDLRDRSGTKRAA